MAYPTIDNTTLTSLSGNLDVGDVADPALRLAYFQYINTFITTVIAKLNSSTLLSSGSESLGSAPIAGATGSTVYAQLVSLQSNIQSIINNVIPPSTVTTTMLQDSSVTSAKLASNSITYADADAATQQALQGGQRAAYQSGVYF